jgi:hypothetical protein
MPGLSKELRDRCHNTLLKCNKFKSDSSVRSVFITKDLWPFRNDLPEGNSKGDRVAKILDYLLEQESKADTPVLVIFLRTLSSHYHPRNALLNRLQKLADDVEKDLAADDSLLVVEAGEPPSRSTLERMISATNSLINPDSFLDRLGRIATQVCRIEVKGKALGTGFLLGPDIVMTNYHVVETVIQSVKGHKPEDVVLRFDHKFLADETTLNSGVVYRLFLPDWLIDHSPYDPVDMEEAPKPNLPHLEKLDYALLRVDGEPGNEPVGQNASPQDSPRGWITLPDISYDFAPKSPLFIVQHPNGEPIKLALDTQAIIELNDNRTRVTYRTNTEPGSSGSPCFNQNWDLVALHHGGDPEFKPMWNEGIPFSTILDLLEKRNLRGIFEK